MGPIGLHLRVFFGYLRTFPYFLTDFVEIRYEGNLWRKNYSSKKLSSPGRIFGWFSKFLRYRKCACLTHVRPIFFFFFVAASDIYHCSHKRLKILNHDRRFFVIFFFKWNLQKFIEKFIKIKANKSSTFSHQ